jgi:1-acyl-sn-glycerol-3-phosphate acyltransferase
MQFLSAIFYSISSWICSIILMLLFGLRVTGLRWWPRRGPALLIANHQSFLDPVAIGCGRPRHLHYLARKTLFDNWLLAWFLRRYNCVPIDQEGIGIEGIRNITARIAAGHAVLVFPEGERTHDGQLQPLKAGIALLFKRTSTPVIPVGIAGAFAAWPRTRRFPIPSPIFLAPTDRSLAVAIGRPRDSQELLRLPREEMLNVLTNDIAREVKRAEAIRRK